MSFKKSFKKLFTTITMLLTVSLLTTSAFAAVPTQSKQLDALSQKYNLRDIKASELPANVKPIEFKTVAEAEAFLEKVNDKNNIQVSVQPAINANSTTDVTTNAVSSYPVGSQTLVVSWWLFGWLNHTATYTYGWDYDNGNNIFIECLSTSSSMSGLNPGVTYQQAEDSSWSYITDNGKTLKAGFTGLLTYYLVIEGTVKIGDATQVITTDFKNP